MTSIRHPPVGLFRPTKFDHALLLNRRAFIAIVAAEFVISPVNGAAQPSDSALVTASAEMKWRNGWSAAAIFEGAFSDVSRSYAGKGVARYAW